MIQIVDKQTLATVKTLGPLPGGDVAFTKGGTYALVASRGSDGAVVVYDATTLKEIRRLPMRDPVYIYTANRR